MNALLFKSLIIDLSFIYISTIEVLTDKGAQYNNSIIIEILKIFFKQNYIIINLVQNTIWRNINYVVVQMQ